MTKTNFQLEPGLLSLMVSVLRHQYTDEARILVASDNLQLIEFVSRRFENETVTVVQATDTEEIAKVKSAGPYDGVVLAPVFGHPAGDTDLPEGWSVPKPRDDEVMLAHASENLAENGRLVAVVAPGLLSSQTRKPIRKKLIEFGLIHVWSIPIDLAFGDSQAIALHSIGLLLLDAGIRQKERTIAFLDLGSVSRLPRTRDLQNLIENSRGNHNLGNELVEVSAAQLSEDLRLDPHFYDPVYLNIKPPLGYSDFELGEISEIRGGIGVYDRTKRYEQDPGEALPYLQVRHLLDDGGIAGDTLWLAREPESEDDSGFARPGDILVSVAGTVGKVALIPEKYSSGVFYDTSIRRVRVDSDYALPSRVERFLRSEIGQLQFRRLTSGSVIPQLTSSALSQLRVFLPELDSSSDGEGELQVEEGIAQARIVASAIEDEVVEYLRNVDTVDDDWQTQIREKLSKFLADFPRTLEEAILTEFPAPIAIPFRRYQSAEFNTYERLQRLVALTDSIIHFTWAVLVADLSTNLHGVIPQLDGTALASARCKDDSTNGKLRFIEQVLQATRSSEYELFMPELTETEIVAVGDTIRSEVRNPTAHSAPGAEQRIERLIEVHEPNVFEALEELRFLGEYTLCRIRNHSYRRGTWVYQAETFKGAEYDIKVGEFPIEGESADNLQFIEAERENLILLDSAFSSLDLNPLYQIYMSEETGLEPHLCFVKRSFPSRNELYGESVRSGMEVRLPGFDDHSSLTAVFSGNADDDSN